MKRLIPMSFAALLSVAMLAGCGLRGDLERPEPVFEQPEEETAETTATRVVTSRTVIRRDANGNIIPNASPTQPVSESGLEDIE